MTPLPPEVVGPISPWNTTVRLKGQIVGGTVAVYCGTDQVIAHATVTQADEIYPLDAGSQFVAGKNVTATQTDGADTSAHSASVVPVQKAPTHLGTLVFESPVYQCGDVVALGGAVPGATVHVGVVSNNQFHERGSGPSADGNADIWLSPATAASETLVAYQSGGGLIGPHTTGPTTIPVTKAIPAPHFQDALIECETVVNAGGVIPGSVLSLTRSSDNSTITGSYVVALAPVYLSTPLVKGETITIKQEMGEPCGYPSPASSATVSPLSGPPAPMLLAPICPNGGVWVENLIVGALVRLLANGQEIGTAEAYDATVHLKPPASLTGGASVTAEQQLCTKWSAQSNAVTAGSVPPSGTLAISMPVTGCATAVHVTGCQPGATVRIISAAHGQIGEAFPLGGTADVAVAPLLTAGDKLEAAMAGCGHQVKSAAITVGKPPSGIKPPSVERPVEHATAVKVDGVAPGAWVEVYVNEAPRAAAAAAQSSITVSILGDAGHQYSPLAIGDKVKARQSLCLLHTDFGPEVVTVPPPPISKFVATPTSGRIPLTVHFADESTGEQITSYKWIFGSEGSSDEQNPPDQQFSAADDYAVTLTVTNAGGDDVASEVIHAFPPAPVSCFNPAVDPQHLTVQFEDCSSGVVDSLTWNFGDGTQVTLPKEATSHTYPNVPSKTYTVTQTANNAGGPGAPVSHQITVTAPPAPPPEHPSIVVDHNGGQQTITVTGNGFAPNHAITIELKDTQGNTETYGAATDGVGHFDPLSIYIQGCTGFNQNPLYIQATDGIALSNVAQTTC